MGQGQSLDLSNFYREDFKILDLGKRVGTTDYIDFIKYDEVNHPVMKGIDKFGRHFVVIKFKLKFNNIPLKIRYKKPILDPENSIILMQTFFQRYTSGGCWMGCGHATEYLLDTSGGLNNDQLKFLEKILDGEILKMKSDLSPVILVENWNLEQPSQRSEIHSNKDIIDLGYTVELYDEEKEKATIKICDFIYMCISNPVYKKCRSIKLGSYDRIINSN